MEGIAREMLGKCPPDFRQHEVKQALAALGGVLPMNIFLAQEIDRIQSVMTLVKTTLTSLKLALEGSIVMSHELKSSLDDM